MEHRVELSLIVPIYQSASHLEAFLRRTMKVICGLGRTCELLLVDDGSRDRTREVLESFLRRAGEDDGAGGQRHIVCRILHLRENVGQQQASLCGLSHAVGEAMVTLDDDLQHRPEDIPRLLAALDEGLDLVYGVPVRTHTSGLRRGGSKLRDMLFFLLFRRNIHPTSFRALKKGLARAVVEKSEDFLYLSVEFFRYSRRIGEVPVHYDRLEEHHSRYPLGRLLRTFAGLALYLPVVPTQLRRRYSGARWTVVEEKKRGLPCV